MNNLQTLIEEEWKLSGERNKFVYLSSVLEYFKKLFWHNLDWLLSCNAFINLVVVIEIN